MAVSGDAFFKNSLAGIIYDYNNILKPSLIVTFLAAVVLLSFQEKELRAFL